MRKIILEGDILTEVENKFKQINALKRTIRSLSSDIQDLEIELWAFIKSEIPSLGSDCRVEEKDGGYMVIERL